MKNLAQGNFQILCHVTLPSTYFYCNVILTIAKQKSLVEQGKNDLKTIKRLKVKFYRVQLVFQ